MSRALFPKTLKVEIERELKREKFLKSKTWLSLTRHEKKKVRALFQQQRPCPQVFWIKTKAVTIQHSAFHAKGWLRCGRAGCKCRAQREVKEGKSGSRLLVVSLPRERGRVIEKAKKEVEG